MGTRTVKVATHPDLMPEAEYCDAKGITSGSAKRDAREGRGPTRKRIGGRVYYWRPEVNEYFRKLFEGE